MSVTVTFDSRTLTEREAGAVASFLLSIHPDALDAAAQHLNQPQLSLDLRTVAKVLERGTPEQPPVAVAPVTIELSAAEAFGAVADAAAAFAASPAPAGTPVAPSPVSSNGPIASPSSGAQLDKTGLPHDKRIHSDPPKMTDKGVWRKRRGLNQLIEHQVVAELRATYPEPLTAAERTAQEAVATGLVPMPPEAGSIAPPVVAAPPPPSAPTVAGADATAPVDPAHFTGRAVASAPTTFNDALEMAAPPPPPAAVVADPDDATPPATQFAGALALATEGQTAGKITTAETLAVATNLGLTAIRDLLAPDNHALIPAFRAGVQALIDRVQA